jgi:hypothetical protein
MPSRHGGRVTSTALEPSYERVCRWEQVGVTVERIVGGPDVRRSRPIIVAEERSDASENRMIPIGDEQRCWVESAPPDWAEYRVFGTRALDQYHRSGWWCHPLATAENSPAKTQRNSCRSVISRELVDFAVSWGFGVYCCQVFDGCWIPVTRGCEFDFWWSDGEIDGLNFFRGLIGTNNRWWMVWNGWW